MQDRETAQKEPCQHCGRTDYRWTHEFRVGLSFSPEDKLEIRCDYCRPLRMDAYYFGFAETGVEAIDRILSAVAQAGKGYHHTESWGDEGLEDMGEFHGGSYVAWIQNAANDAAKVIASPLSAPPQAEQGHIDIVCDGPPDHAATRFIEVENAKGQSISFGAWTQRPDGYWALRIPAPPQEPTGDSPQADVTCEHGTAMDVHCCNCHSGFIFDVNHECPSPELTWREAVEQALGVANDPENHTPSWAFDVVMAAREIGNAPSPASPQAETSANVRALTVHICEDCLNLRGEMCNEPGCRFCRRTMAEVAEYLDVLLIRPRIDGVSVLIDEGALLTNCGRSDV